MGCCSLDGRVGHHELAMGVGALDGSSGLTGWNMMDWRWVWASFFAWMYVRRGISEFGAAREDLVGLSCVELGHGAARRLVGVH